MTLKFSAGSRLADILGSSPRTVNTTHHQAIRDPLHLGFEVSARAPDGTIEAIEPTNEDYVVGVQWHPEKLSPPDNQELFNDLVRAAAEPAKLDSTNQMALIDLRTPLVLRLRRYRVRQGGRTFSREHRVTHSRVSCLWKLFECLTMAA